MKVEGIRTRVVPASDRPQLYWYTQTEPDEKVLADGYCDTPIQAYIAAGKALQGVKIVAPWLKEK